MCLPENIFKIIDEFMNLCCKHMRYSTVVNKYSTALNVFFTGIYKISVVMRAINLETYVLYM